MLRKCSVLVNQVDNNHRGIRQGEASVAPVAIETI
jgi:hypothetical protein